MFDPGTLRHFEIRDKDTVKKFLCSSEPQLCDYSFANLYCWGPVYDIRFTIYENRLIIFDGRDGFLLMPMGGKCEPEFYLTLSDSMLKAGLSGDIFLVEQEYVEKHEQFFSQHFSLSISESMSDYLYSVEKLVELKGKKLHKKKNLISQFTRKNPVYRVDTITSQNIDEYLYLVDEWCHFAGNCGSPGVQDENNALRRALRAYSDLELSGVAIMAPDLIAFSIYEKLNSNTAVVHFEKSDQKIKGAGQIINWEVSKHMSDRFELVNREQDMGIPGLRQAKRSYEPVRLVHSYTLKRNP